ncbi:MAG TPA: 2OG-Fe(II) oxygenase [Archangium sp.]|uniref:2OG-Fe(II) oxygenase n=1 Tax=Archangium sp. TaxID=1872627 RepID=UPI002ED919EE
MRKPERVSGFFIPDLVENVFGEDWRGPPAVNVEAARWIHPTLLDPAIATGVRAAFGEGGRVPHVCLSDALAPPVAESVHEALTRARFVPHHHAPYPLSIARQGEQEPSALTGFVQWLGTDAAADYHAWLVGWRQKLVAKQVQVSRMGVGERFPVHVDTEDEGLAVVYNFTRPWEERFGGVLHFPHPSGKGDELRIPPLFNSVFIFRSRGAPHGVSQVLPEAGARFRYTVTSFFLAEG